MDRAYKRILNRKNVKKELDRLKQLGATIKVLPPIEGASYYRLLVSKGYNSFLINISPEEYEQWMAEV